ncbi:MAG TPA: hypothetical protein VK152_08810 [Paludibacter sp.]|nr:hypothetical protein [Paludibacter sp.]
MNLKSKRSATVSFVLLVCLLAVASCSTSNPPVDTKTGATTTTPKK